MYCKPSTFNAQNTNLTTHTTVWQRQGRLPATFTESRDGLGPGRVITYPSPWRRPRCPARSENMLGHLLIAIRTDWEVAGRASGALKMPSRRTRRIRLQVSHLGESKSNRIRHVRRDGIFKAPLARPATSHAVRIVSRRHAAVLGRPSSSPEPPWPRATSVD